MRNDKQINHTFTTDHETSHDANAEHSDGEDTHGSPSTHDEVTDHHETVKNPSKETTMKQTNLRKIAGLVLATLITLLGISAKTTPASTQPTASNTDCSTVTGVTAEPFTTTFTTKSKTIISSNTATECATPVETNFTGVYTRTRKTSRATTFTTRASYFEGNPSSQPTSRCGTDKTVNSSTFAETIAGGTGTELTRITTTGTDCVTANDTFLY